VEEGLLALQRRASLGYGFSVVAQIANGVSNRHRSIRAQGVEVVAVIATLGKV